ncbi:peptidase S10, serine carboxypeptidase [Ramicandelaber brevisporus]|nr:peptidase S10, serine carboxypeptidase [Ramicandelaber brevisporus]
MKLICTTALIVLVVATATAAATATDTTARPNRRQQVVTIPQLSSVDSIFRNAALDTLLSKSRLRHGLNPTLKTFLSVPEHPNHIVRIKQPSTCDPSVKQYSGYIDTADDKHLFFHFFESRGTPSTDPLVVWQNGGPGCSSMLGLYMELGPCRINEVTGEPVRNEHAWNANANVIFIDQPAGVGFSHGSSVWSTRAAADDLMAFLDIFLDSFPEYRTDGGLHLFSESYGGKYTPALGHILREADIQRASALRDDDKSKSLQPFNLRSIGIGNPLVDPMVQIQHYGHYACKGPYGPVLNQTDCDEMDRAVPMCVKLLQFCYDNETVLRCLPALYCNKVLSPFDKSGRNIYDVRQPCEADREDMCYPIGLQIKAYLDRQDVREELGVESSEFVACSESVGKKFVASGDVAKPTTKDVAYLLENGVRVLVYAGDADFMCNFEGVEAFTKQMEWSGKRGFNNNTSVGKWLVSANNTAPVRHAGNVRSFGGLTFLRIFEAGHMVPYDQPELAFDMITRWLNQKPLS